MKCLLVIAVFGAIAVSSALAAEVDRSLVPQLSRAIDPIKRSYLGSRYNKINDYLLKNSASDEPADVIKAAKKWDEDLRDKKKAGKELSSMEIAVREILEFFVKLEEVIEDISEKKCSDKAQALLEWNDHYTKGLIYQEKLGKDLFAGTVRKLVLKRAEKCQDVYLEETSLGYKRAMFNVEKHQVIGDLYIDFVDKLVADLKAKNKFVPYVVPKEIETEKLGEYVFRTVIAMAKQSGDERGEKLEKLAINPIEPTRMVSEYIIDGGKVVNVLGKDYFIMAAMDKRVAGEKGQFSWMKDKLFLRRLEAFLFATSIKRHSGIIYEHFLEFLRKHEDGRFAKKLDAILL